MATNSYYKGQKVTVTALFKNSAGTLADPSAVYAQYQNPSNEETSLQYGVDDALGKSAVGTYYIDIDANEVGTWYYRFYSTGTGQAASEGYFTIAESEF